MANEPKYTTNLKFNKALEMDKQIPNRDSGNPTKESVVQTANNSTTVYYLDNGFVIRNSDTLYYAKSTNESVATATLTRDTDYTIDYDLGTVTLGTAVLTTVSGLSIFATYSFNKYSKKDSEIYNNLTRAVSLFDSATNTVFVQGTAMTPKWGTVSNELKIGQGLYNTVYQTDNYPVNKITTNLTGAVSTAATTVYVSSTNGFPASGTFGLGTEKVTYTSKTTTAFTVSTGIYTTHTVGTKVTPFVVEMSADDSGNTPTWIIQAVDTGFSLEPQGGEISMNKDIVSNIYVIDNEQPPKGVFDRVRLSYQYGMELTSEQLLDIQNAIHLIAGKSMFNTQVLNALARSTDGFSTDSISDVNNQIKAIINKYQAWMIKDTKP